VGQNLLAVTGKNLGKGTEAAITLFDSLDTCGVTTLLGAMAYRRPVIVIQSPGLVDDLSTPNILTTVPAGAIPALQQAIEQLLHNPELAHVQVNPG